MKSAIITDLAESQKRFSSLAVNNPSSDAEDPATHNAEDQETSLASGTQQDEACNIPAEVEEHNFVVVKVYSSSSKFKHFISQILSGPDNENDYEIKFLKRST